MSRSRQRPQQLNQCARGPTGGIFCMSDRLCEPKNDTDRRAGGSCEKDASLVVQHSRDRVLRHRRPRFPMSAEHRKQAQAEKSHNERNHKCARSSVTSNHNVRFDAPVRWCDDCVSPSPNNFEQNKNRARVELGRGRREGFWASTFLELQTHLYWKALQIIPVWARSKRHFGDQYGRESAFRSPCLTIR